MCIYVSKYLNTEFLVRNYYCVLIRDEQGAGPDQALYTNISVEPIHFSLNDPSSFTFAYHTYT